MHKWQLPRISAALTGALLAACLGSTAAAEPTLPVFDTHVHYSEDVWQSFSPEAVLELMQRAGVTRALVSSTPDVGTLMLRRADAARIVPELRPYRSPADRHDWFRNDEVLAYVEARLAHGGYRGLGEFHLLDAEDVETRQMARLVRLAIEHELVLHVHSDAAVIEALFNLEPKVRILWAHAGMSAPPALIADMLERFPALWTELALRAAEIAPGGRLSDEWRALFLRHPERFMVGTDTWLPSRWPDYADLVQAHRAWLEQLPAAVAAGIAHANAARLYRASE